jgi:hypothetical protein
VDVINSTVLSGWVQSQNRFGLCLGAYGGTYRPTDDLAGDCDNDPNVIGFLQTISMQWICIVSYSMTNNNSQCDWRPAYAFNSIQWEARPNYVPGTNGAPIANGESACFSLPPYLFLASLTFLLSKF